MSRKITSPVLTMTALVVALLLSTATRSIAQDAAAPALAGIVRDASGGSIARATVAVRSLTTAVTRIAETTRDGRFRLTDLPAGDYEVTIVAIGFAAHVGTLTVPSAPQEIALQPAPVLEEVKVVSAARQEELRQSLNTRVDVISRSRIEDSGAETVAEVLRELPGVLSRRGSETAGPAGEQIQGIDSRQVLVLIDGQPITGARGIKRGVLNLDRQSTARLDRIEVVKGAASALYGSDAMGGVINLITRDAAAPLDLGATASGGNYGDVNLRVEAGGRTTGTSLFFVGERHQHDGFDLTPTTFDTTGAAAKRTDALFKASIRPRAALTISGLFTGYTTHSVGRSNGELGPQADDVDEDTVNVGVTVEWQAHPLTSVQARGYLSRYDERSTASLAPPRSTPLEPGSLDEDLEKFDVSISHVLGATQQLQGGVEYWSNRYAGYNRIAFDAGVRATTTTAWAQHRLTLGNRLTTTLGARIDRHSEFGTAVSPKAAANIRVRDGVHARVSYGRGFRAPDLGQLFYRFLNPSSIYQVIGNPNLHPEYANSLQLGADFQSSSRRVRFGVNVFRNDVRDLIESVTLGTAVTADELAALLAREGLDPSFRPVLGRLLLTYKNINDARTAGLELDGEVAATANLVLGGAYTYLDARDTKADLNLTGRHPHQAHVRATWAHERIGLRLNARMTMYSSWIAARATQTSGPPLDTRAPAFELVDVAASQRVTKGLSMFAAVDNLFDDQDPNTGVLTPAGTPATIYRPEIGRTVRVGLRWAWAAR